MSNQIFDVDFTNHNFNEHPLAHPAGTKSIAISCSDLVKVGETTENPGHATAWASLKLSCQASRASLKEISL